MKTRRVYVTDWGEADHDNLPDDLRQRLGSAIFTKQGMPDLRSKRSVQAWRDLERWVADRLNGA